MESNTAEIIRWEAQRLAAAGHRQAALELLNHLPAPAGAGAAVLRGRILGQQGRFGPAAESFRLALEAEPRNEDAQRGLREVEKLSRGPLGGLRLRLRAGVAAVLAIALLGSLAWRADAAWRASNRELTSSLAALEKKIAASDAGEQASANALAERLGRMEEDLRAQAQVSGKANNQLKSQLQRVQSQLSTMQAPPSAQTGK